MNNIKDYKKYVAGFINVLLFFITLFLTLFVLGYIDLKIIKMDDLTFTMIFAVIVYTAGALGVLLMDKILLEKQEERYPE